MRMVRRRLGVFWSVRWGRRSTGNSFKPGGGVFFFFFWPCLVNGMGWDGLMIEGRRGGVLLYWYFEKEKGGCECGLFLGRGGGMCW